MNSRSERERRITMKIVINKVIPTSGKLLIELHVQRDSWNNPFDPRTILQKRSNFPLGRHYARVPRILLFVIISSRA